MDGDQALDNELLSPRSGSGCVDVMGLRPSGPGDLSTSCGPWLRDMHCPDISFKSNKPRFWNWGEHC